MAPTSLSCGFLQGCFDAGLWVGLGGGSFLSRGSSPKWLKESLVPKVCPTSRCQRHKKDSIVSFLDPVIREHPPEAWFWAWTMLVLGFDCDSRVNSPELAPFVLFGLFWAPLCFSLTRQNIWVRLNIKQEGQTAGVGPCFHLPIGQPILEFRVFWRRWGSKLPATCQFPRRRLRTNPAGTLFVVEEAATFVNPRFGSRSPERGRGTGDLVAHAQDPFLSTQESNGSVLLFPWVFWNGHEGTPLLGFGLKGSVSGFPERSVSSGPPWLLPGLESPWPGRKPVLKPGTVNMKTGDA